MSAVATKKPGADYGVQLTYPTVFAEQYKEDNIPEEYYPEHIQPVHLQKATDLQGDYHQKKMEDAHRMVMAKVKSKHSMNYRAEHGPHGYYQLPAVELGQRVYANPSNGNQADIYSHRPIKWNVDWNNHYKELHGGVLYTAEAQRWGHRKLKDRVRQLDNIDIAKSAFTNRSKIEGLIEKTQEVGDKLKIELVGHLQGLLGATEEGQLNSFSFGDLIKFQKLLFRWASTASEEELKDILDMLNYVLTNLRGLESEAQTRGVKKENYAYIVANNVEKLREYVKGMIETVDMAPAERKSVSSSLIKHYGFTQLSRKALERVEDTPAFGSNKQPMRPAVSKFDPLPREKMGKQNGEYMEDFGDQEDDEGDEGEEGDEEDEGDERLRSQGFQNLKDQVLPEEQGEEEIQKALEKDKGDEGDDVEAYEEYNEPVRDWSEDEIDKHFEDEGEEANQIDLGNGFTLEHSLYSAQMEIPSMSKRELIRLVNELSEQGFGSVRLRARDTKEDIIDKLRDSFHLYKI